MSKNTVAINDQAELNIIGAYSKDGEVELRGDQQSLSALANHLRAHIETPAFFVAPRPNLPNPYDGFLSALKVDFNEDAVVFNIEDDMLLISGSQEKIDILAENIDWLASQNNGESKDDHLHIEYHPDHFYLAPSAISIIICQQASKTSSSLQRNTNSER